MDAPLVVFDLGNVLIRIADDWAHACSLAKVDVGAAWPLSEEKRAQLHELVVANEIGQLDHDRFCALAATLFGLEASHIAAVSDAYLVAPFPGVRQLLDDLAARRIETACLSNTNVSHWNLMLAKEGHASLPLERLNYRFASQEVGARKPDLAIYEHVERITGRAAGDILFFDDKPENLAPAVRRGWRTVHIDPRDPDPITTMREKLIEFEIL